MPHCKKLLVLVELIKEAVRIVSECRAVYKKVQWSGEWREMPGAWGKSLPRLPDIFQYPPM